MRSILIFLILTACWALRSEADLSLDVSPIRVQVNVIPGDSYTNSVRVLNAGQEAIRLRSYVEDWTLNETGIPIFEPAGTEKRTASLWIDAAPSDFLLEPGETKFVRFTVDVPGGVLDGGYHTSLILESLPLDRSKEGAMRMFVQGRVACMIYTSVGNPRRAAEITSLRPVQCGTKRCVRMTIMNRGQDFVRLAGNMAVFLGDDPKGPVISLPDVPVLPESRRVVDVDLPVEFAAESVVRVSMDLDGIGKLIGICPLDPDKVLLVP